MRVSEATQAQLSLFITAIFHPGIDPGEKKTSAVSAQTVHTQVQYKKWLGLWLKVYGGS